MMFLVSTSIKTEEDRQVDERLCDRPHNKAVVLAWRNAALGRIFRATAFPS